MDQISNVRTKEDFSRAVLIPAISWGMILRPPALPQNPKFLSPEKHPKHKKKYIKNASNLPPDTYFPRNLESRSNTVSRVAAMRSCFHIFGKQLVRQPQILRMKHSSEYIIT